MTGCRIGKVTPRDRKLAVLKVHERAYVQRAVGTLSSAICEDAILVGFFVVRKNRSCATGWSYDAGITDTDFLGGCDRLKQSWIEKEMT